MKKLFTNDRFFLAMVLCAVVGEATGAFISIFAFNYSLQTQLTLLFRVACVIILFYSYKKHSKNIMKGIMGSLLAGQLISSIQYLSNMRFDIEYISTLLFAFFSVLLFINHFIINSEHHSSPKQIKFNQLLVILLFLNCTSYNMLWCIYDCTLLTLVWCIVDTVGFLGMVSVVVCVESRLDAYRLDREAAGWTEEKGYPENYIHQKDR